MGLYGALRGLTAAARIVRGVQLTGTAIKIKRKADRIHSSVERYIRKNIRLSGGRGVSNDMPSSRADTMTGRYIAGIMKQSR
jgi:hypothetical protein